ncbi:PAS domain S-box protein [Blastococcus sp. TF02A-30]|nr:PAS domain S-box protein [Blastococcus sp. TF02A-30]
MPAAFCLLDHDWRFRYVNGEAERLMALPREDVLGRSLWDAFPGVAGSVYEERYRTCVATGEPVRFEASHPDSADSWYEVRAWPGPHGLAVYLLDVTDRRDAEDLARRATARAALVSRITAELAEAADPESALARLARLVVPTLTDACIVTVVDREGRARDVGSWHRDRGRRALLAEYAQVRLETLPSTSPVARALSAGTPVTEPVRAILPLLRPGPARDLLEALRPETAVVLPLLAEGRPVGVLTLYHDRDRAVRDEDLETARQVAVQAGQAVARVHLQHRRAELAEALQRSLLTDPPDTGDAEVAVRYVPAAEAARVGGDWYDAFLQRTGDPVIVIGDVVGHDTRAAAAMGQLRGLLRGIAHHSGAGPAEVLHGLDRAMCDMHTDTLATAAVARFERSGTGSLARMRLCNAGHPPPMALAPDGTVTVLGDPVGDLMLGVDGDAGRRERLVELPPGTTVLLYTDGLVERRDGTLDEGLERLAGSLRGLAGRPLEQLCGLVLERMLTGTPQDDVALVAVRLSAV